MRIDKLTTKFQEALGEAQSLALGNDHAYIEPAHVLVAMLRQDDGPKALLQQTLVSSGTMTNRIDRLVGRQLVERRTDPNDGRGILVMMTAAGVERVDRAISQLVDGEATLLAGLSTPDRERLAGLLRKLSLDFDA